MSTSRLFSLAAEWSRSSVEWSLSSVESRDSLKMSFSILSELAVSLRSKRPQVVNAVERQNHILLWFNFHVSCFPYSGSKWSSLLRKQFLAINRRRLNSQLSELRQRTLSLDLATKLEHSATRLTLTRATRRFIAFRLLCLIPAKCFVSFG